MRSRGGGERATPRVANARPRGGRGGGGPGGNRGVPGCKSPSCGCYWQPSLCGARSHAAGKEGGEGRRLRRRGGRRPAARRAPARPRPAVPPGRGRSCVARRAKGLLGWGCHCLWSVKLLAPSVKATWQLGLEDPAHSVRPPEGGAAGGAGLGPHLPRPASGSPAAPGAASRAAPPRLHPGPFVSRSGAVTESLAASTGVAAASWPRRALRGPSPGLRPWARRRPAARPRLPLRCEAAIPSASRGK